VDFNFRIRHRLCNFLKRGNGYDERQNSQRCEVNLSVISLLVRSQEAPMPDALPLSIAFAPAFFKPRLTAGIDPA
jgi:hypothetical protein